MIEVLDEILAGEPRYRVKDSKGNIIYDNVTMEQITSVLVEGTPLNKHTFNTLERSFACSAKYNSPMSFTKTPIKIGDLLAGTWTSSDNKNWTKGDLNITLSSTNTLTVSNFNNMFDGSDSTRSTLQDSGSGAGTYVYMDVKFPQQIRAKLRVSAYVYGSASWCKVLAKKDVNSSWVEIQNLGSGGTGSTAATRTAVLDIPAFYQYYRIQFYQRYSTGNGLYAVELQEYVEPYNRVMYFNNPISSYVEGLRFLVDTGHDVFFVDDTPLYININGLGEKLIYGQLNTDTKYELAYDGTLFEFTEKMM